MNNKKGFFCVAFAAVLWGVIGVFYKQVKLLGFSNFQAVFLRTSLAAVFMALFLLFKNKSHFKIKLKDIWIFICSGVVSLAFFNVCYYKCIELSTMSIGAGLLYTAPAFVMIMSVIFFKEKLGINKISALILTLIGSFLIAGIVGKIHLTALAILAGIGSGIGYALYSIFSTVALKKGYKSETVSLYTFIFASIGILPFSEPETILKNFKGVDLSGYLWIIGCALITCVLPYIFYTKSLKFIPASKASVIATIEPVTATLISIFIFKEKTSAVQIIGIALILSAIVFLNINFGKGKKNGTEKN